MIHGIRLHRKSDVKRDMTHGFFRTQRTIGRYPYAFGGMNYVRIARKPECNLGITKDSPRFVPYY